MAMYEILVSLKSVSSNLNFGNLDIVSIVPEGFRWPVNERKRVVKVEIAGDPHQYCCLVCNSIDSDDGVEIIKKAKYKIDITPDPNEIIEINESNIIEK